MKSLCVLIFALLSLQVQAQLGFCSGSKGDPIFHENFGSGSGTGEELPPGITSYTFIEGSDPNDGEYTISDDIGNSITSWHNSLPNSTVSNGRALIVNADFNAGQFYRIGVSGLCENTTYEFSAYLMNVYDRGSNVCEAGGIPINVRFEIWDETDSVLLKSGNTGDIQSSLNAEWEQYALTFSSEPGQEGVILKMFNNGEGGCGNDLAIDDIIFRSCGDLTTVSSDVGVEGSYEICEENSPAGITLEAIPDFSVYEEHYFQWQQSSDGENWQDIAGKNSSVFEKDGIDSTIYFRVKVAEDPVNLLSNVCSSASEHFKVEVFETPTAPVSLGNISICSDETIPGLRVSTNEDEEVYWFDSETGGNLLAEKSSVFTPQTEGTYFAEARLKGQDCAASQRTEVKLSIFEIPEVTDELLQLCPDSMLELDAGVQDQEYIWNTGEITQSIVVESPGTYSVEVRNSSGCSSIKTIEVVNVPNARILEVISDDTSVEIIPEFEGDFEFSLDGTNFQDSNHFDTVEGGIYTAYIRDLAACKVDQVEFPHIVIPKFITPNNDGYNEEFRIKGLNYFESSLIRIFDRYGKLLKAGPGTNFSWTGQYNGTALPSGDYWYEIRIHGYPPETGHFSLVR